MIKYDSFNCWPNDEFIGKHPEYPKLTDHQSEVLSKVFWTDNSARDCGSTWSWG